MARLIIGHVSDNNARIWVRGTEEQRSAFLKVTDAAGNVVFQGSQDLEARHFFTGVFEVGGLSPTTSYQCEVHAALHSGSASIEQLSFPDNTGRFKTFPPATGGHVGVSFLLGSCNLHSLGILSQPDPAYKRLSDLAAANACDFMIHCGDQIYADIPLAPPPLIDHYRRKYLDAWNDSQETRRFLTQLPHYMVLDDHEIINNFHNDLEPSTGPLEAVQIASLKAYREFQHIHNPQTFGSDPLYYTFSHGDVHFFVMDVRTERFEEEPGNQIIDDVQMDRFKQWLLTHAAKVKFVVSSVTFVGEVRNDDDKWSAPSYIDQKNEILSFLVANNVGRVVFLTGDMHNSFHAQLRASDGNGGRVDVHELMSSPINQITKTSIGRYQMGRSHRFTKPTRLNYTANFGQTSNGATAFFSGHSNVMVVTVTPDAVAGRARVGYEIFRTKRDSPAEMTGSFLV